MKNFFRILLVLILAAGIYACSGEAEGYEAGSVCTIRDSAGQYRLAKVLVINDEMAHLMLFKRIYPERPATIGPDDLKLGEPSDSEGDSTGSIHVALAREEFMNWQPVVVAYEKVVDEDLEGYRHWKDDQPK